MHFHVITLFPDMVRSYVNESIIGRALRDKTISVSLYNPRDFTKDKKRRVDQKPYGGGPGMVLEAAPIISAAKKAIGRKKGVKVIFFSPHGTQFTGAYASKLARRVKHVVLICGHYEGIDARVQKVLKAEPVSIGPYVLTGGELPALAVIDATCRKVAGVLGNYSSLEEGRIAGKDVYTRPEVLEVAGKRYRVPKVLLSGNHKKIEEWKRNT